MEKHKTYESIPNNIDLYSITQDIRMLVIKAGNKIREIYDSDPETGYEVEYKADQTPLTLADRESNAIIVEYLKENYPKYAILSEEMKDDLHRLDNEFCWIVDPLDGTKEFLKRNGEFTVNIALAYRGKSILGAIYAPILDELYFAASTLGCFYRNKYGEIISIHVSKRINHLRIVSSRTHKSPTETELFNKFVKRIDSEISIGSSLKGCLIARGSAEIYYRSGYTMEWDTAAMQCIVEEAGGLFLQIDMAPMRYNRHNSLNEKGFFIVNDSRNILHLPNYSEMRYIEMNDSYLGNSGSHSIESIIRPKSKNIVWHSGSISQQDREQIIGQKGHVMWFTGLSGSGKSTLAVELENYLIQKGKIAYILDGDNIRHGINSDLSFSERDRRENIRRIGEIAKILADIGIIVICSFISPLREMRDFVREIIPEKRFSEIFIKADIDTCISRDPKGLYVKALSGEIQNFTGISAPFEEPESPELIIDTTKKNIFDSLTELISYISNTLKNL